MIVQEGETKKGRPEGRRSGRRIPFKRGWNGPASPPRPTPVQISPTLQTGPAENGPLAQALPSQPVGPVEPALPALPAAKKAKQPKHARKDPLLQEILAAKQGLAWEKPPEQASMGGSGPVTEFPTVRTAPKGPVSPRHPAPIYPANDPRANLSDQDLTYLPTFAQAVLGMPLYACQSAVLADLDPPGSEVTCVTANGVGKTSMLAAAPVLWHSILYPGSVTVTTSGVFRQVKEQMWPRIRQLARMFPSIIDGGPNMTEFTVQHKGGEESRVVGFSTDDPGKFEGWHGKSLLMVLDECKTIPDDIYEATERCKQGQRTRRLLLSSPGPSSGFFYRSHKDPLVAPFHKRHKIQATNCPHIIEREGSADPKTWAITRKWGIDHPLVQSQVFAEFMDGSNDRFICPEHVYRACLASKPHQKGTDRIAFCDFAAGGDENVFAYREGNQVLSEALTCWRDTNTMAAVGRFLQLFRRYRLEPNQVYADCSGLGIPMCDALAEAGFAVHRVNNGARAYDDREFANRGAEIWYTAARLIEKAEVGLPVDQVLLEQVTTRRSKVDHKGRLVAEPKPDMAKRGLASPDRADAVLGCLACASINSDILSPFARQSPLEVLSSIIDEGEHTGFDAGY